MNKRGFTFYEMILIICIIIVVAVFVILPIYAMITYADTPISETPVWVWYVLNLGGSK